jgi:hypothetical protein
MGQWLIGDFSFLDRRYRLFGAVEERRHAERTEV